MSETLDQCIRNLRTGKVPYDEVVRRYYMRGLEIAELRAKLAQPTCQFCDAPATCVGYGENAPYGFACDDHCGHGGEDGQCWTFTEFVEHAEKLRRSWLSQDEQLADLEQELADFQAAALLGEDPAKVTPAIAEKQVVDLRQELADAKAANIPVETHHCRETHTACACVLRDCARNVTDPSSLVRDITAALAKPGAADGICERCTGSGQVFDSAYGPMVSTDVETCPSCNGTGKATADTDDGTTHE